MAVKEILDKRVIDLDMNAKTKDEVIRHLAGLLHEAGYVDDLEGIHQRCIFKRERRHHRYRWSCSNPTREI